MTPDLFLLFYTLTQVCMFVDLDDWIWMSSGARLDTSAVHYSWFYDMTPGMHWKLDLLLSIVRSLRYILQCWIVPDLVRDPILKYTSLLYFTYYVCDVLVGLFQLIKIPVGLITTPVELLSSFLE